MWVRERTFRGTWKSPEQKEKEAHWTYPELSAREVRMACVEHTHTHTYTHAHTTSYIEQVSGRREACELPAASDHRYNHWQ